jgi:hypothetical protein
MTKSVFAKHVTLLYGLDEAVVNGDVPAVLHAVDVSLVWHEA